MTLPKTISDAIKAYGTAVAEWSLSRGECRAALEAAIAAAIAERDCTITDLHGAPTGSLERLRDRVQERMECTDHLGRLVWDEPTRRTCRDVLEWIDEERGAPVFERKDGGA